MRGLTLGVLIGFFAVTLAMVWRWSDERSAEADQYREEPRRVVEPASDYYETDEGNIGPREEQAGEGSARRDLSGVSGDSRASGVGEAMRGLSLALDLGFEREEALALARSQAPGVLLAFFAEHTHIDAEWLHRSGLDPKLLPELYARWAAGARKQEHDSAPGDVLLSRFSPGSDGGPYRAQRSFQPQDRTVFLHYSLPEHYQPEAVLVRWIQAPDDGRPPSEALQHFDRHPLTGDPRLRQEAWMRPAEGWDPGDYRVEIFSADAELQLLASQSYRVE